MFIKTINSQHFFKYLNHKQSVFLFFFFFFFSYFVLTNSEAVSCLPNFSYLLETTKLSKLIFFSFLRRFETTHLSSKPQVVLYIFKNRFCYLHGCVGKKHRISRGNLSKFPSNFEGKKDWIKR